MEDNELDCSAILLGKESSIFWVVVRPPSVPFWFEPQEKVNFTAKLDWLVPSKMVLAHNRTHIGVTWWTHWFYERNIYRGSFNHKSENKVQFAEYKLPLKIIWIICSVHRRHMCVVWAHMSFLQHLLLFSSTGDPPREGGRRVGASLKCEDHGSETREYLLSTPLSTSWNTAPHHRPESTFSLPSCLPVSPSEPTLPKYCNTK